MCCFLRSDAEETSGRFFFFFQAEDGIRDIGVTGVQTCALPILPMASARRCGGVPLTNRQMSRPAVRLEAKITPNRNASSRSAASSGFDVTANSLLGHA